MNSDGLYRCLVFLDLTNESFQGLDGDGFITGLHFIGTAAGAFPGEVFKALGGEERHNAFKHLAEGTSDDEFDVIGGFQDNSDLIDAEPAEHFEQRILFRIGCGRFC